LQKLLDVTQSFMLICALT